MIRFRFLSASAAAALALTGCATAGPDYALPADSIAVAPSAQGAFDAGDNPAFASDPLPDRWWQLYDDPRLDDLVQQALAANADLRAADANLLRAEAVLRETAGEEGLGASVEGSLMQERNHSLRSAGAGLSGVLTGQIGLQLTYPLDLHGKITRAIEASSADRDATEAARDHVRITVAAATARAYAQVCAANDQIATAQNIVDLQQQTLDATRRLQQGGRGTAFDVSRAQSAVDSSKAALPALRAQRQGALYLLATLLGKPPADYPRDIAQCDALPRLARPMPISDGAALIRRRPDIRQAERMLAADTARIGVAMADLYPSVSIAGGLMLFNRVGDLPDTDSISFGLGPLLSWNWPYRTQVDARIDQADAQVQADKARFDATVLDALRSAETALDSYANDLDQAAALQRASQSAALSADQAATLFRYGRSDFLSLLSAQSALASAEARHATAEAALVDDQIAIFLALGGGWQTG
jgi:outer membrane protein, multidrug efflux system